MENNNFYKGSEFFLPTRMAPKAKKLLLATIIATALVGCDNSDERLLEGSTEGEPDSGFSIVDTDGDGLPYYVEPDLGLDHEMMDTSGNGMPDGQRTRITIQFLTMKKYLSG